MSSVEKDANLLIIHNLLPFTYTVAFASNESRGICEKWVILMGPQLGKVWHQKLEWGGFSILIIYLWIPQSIFLEDNSFFHHFSLDCCHTHLSVFLSQPFYLSAWMVMTP